MVFSGSDAKTMQAMTMPYVEANGARIPAIGLGTWDLRGRTCARVVEQALRLGYLKPGDRLPTVKDTVAFLAINPNTVLKAYRELEHRGLAGGRPGQGTFVEGTLGKVGLPEQTELRRVLLSWLRTADAAGLDEAGMVALLTSALRDFHDRRSARQAAAGGPAVAQSRRSRRGSRDDGTEGAA